MRTFSSVLTSLRLESGLSAQSLAEAAGISRQAVHMLESGERKPSLETAERLAIALGKKLRVFEGCGVSS